MEATQQRRVTPRVARQLIVRYRSRPEAPWRPATLKDLSCDGARLLSEETFEPTQSLQLQFGLPLFPQPVQIVGRVAWKKPAFSGHLQITEYGFSFTGVDAAIRQALTNAVQRFLKRSS